MLEIKNILTCTVVHLDLKAFMEFKYLALCSQTLAIRPHPEPLLSKYSPLIVNKIIVLNFRSGNLAQVYKNLYSMTLRESGKDSGSAVVTHLLDVLSKVNSILSSQQEMTR
jgi:hypothetical protein